VNEIFESRVVVLMALVVMLVVLMLDSGIERMQVHKVCDRFGGIIGPPHTPSDTTPVSSNNSTYPSTGIILHSETSLHLHMRCFHLIVQRQLFNLVDIRER
jgi:hypothetical protein